MLLRPTSLSLSLLALTACNPATTPTDAPVTPDGGETVTDAGTTVDAPAAECVAHVAACSDEQIAGLMFRSTASGGTITEEGTTSGEFTSLIDASAGGFMGTLGYTYARFTDTGLEAVPISDEQSLDSTDWDIAFRRYVVRLNSGISGPGCTTGGRVGPGTTFETLTSVPSDLELFEEQYFTPDTCEFVPDTSGIGAPQTVLSSYWSYPGCVAMTDNVYVVRTGTGRAIKLQVLSYYDPAVQETCDTTGMAPTPNGAGTFRVRWAFLPE